MGHEKRGGMEVFCTYCSFSKSEEAGEIPAIRRYQSPRIVQVYSAANQLGIPFFIFSGKYGLISPSEPIPYYDHLLSPDEVPAMAETVAGQIGDFGITGIVYFTRSLSDNANLLPYHDAVMLACRAMSIPFLAVELPEEDEPMSNWREIMEAAEGARLTIISDRDEGERHFGDLLRRYPRDGMVYFKRGEAYEAIEEYELAADDYQRAIVLFPQAIWKERARQALDRVKAKMKGGSTAPAGMRITYDPEVDALSIRFIETPVTTHHVGEGIAVDYAANGRIAGVEILDARRRVGDPEVFRRVTLDGLELDEAS